MFVLVVCWADVWNKDASEPSAGRAYSVLIVVSHDVDMELQSLLIFFFLKKVFLLMMKKKREN